MSTQLFIFAKSSQYARATNYHIYILGKYLSTYQKFRGPMGPNFFGGPLGLLTLSLAPRGWEGLVTLVWKKVKQVWLNFYLIFGPPPFIDNNEDGDNDNVRVWQYGNENDNDNHNDNDDDNVRVWQASDCSSCFASSSAALCLWLEFHCQHSHQNNHHNHQPNHYHKTHHYPSLEFHCQHSHQNHHHNHRKNHYQIITQIIIINSIIIHH